MVGPHVPTFGGFPLVIEGSLEVKLPTIWTRQMEKQRWEESEKRKSQKKEDPGARKGRKVAKLRNTMFFQ
jgi:hypothetical protein